MNKLTGGTVCAVDAATGAEIGPSRKPDSKESVIETSDSERMLDDWAMAQSFDPESVLAIFADDCVRVSAHHDQSDRSIAITRIGRS